MKLNKKQIGIFLGWLAIIWLMKLPWGMLSATITTTVVGVMSLGGIYIGDKMGL